MSEIKYFVLLGIVGLISGVVLRLNSPVAVEPPSPRVYTMDNLAFTLNSVSSETNRTLFDPFMRLGAASIRDLGEKFEVIWSCETESAKPELHSAIDWYNPPYNKVLLLWHETQLLYQAGYSAALWKGEPDKAMASYRERIPGMEQEMVNRLINRIYGMKFYNPENFKQCLKRKLGNRLIIKDTQ